MLSPKSKAGTNGGCHDGESGSEESPGKWRGHIGALFSPVLRFLGGAETEALDEQQLAQLQQQHEERMEMAQAEAAAEAAAEQAAAEAARLQQEQAEAEEDEEMGYEEFDPYLFMKQLPPYSTVGADVRPQLPPRRMTRNSPLTLVLDLDETLVHCSVEASARADLVFPVNFNGVEYQVHVQKRPHLEYFLREVAKSFEVVIFTASQQVYADKLLDNLDPKREMIKYRLFRESCLFVEGNYLKDLNVLGRDMSKMVLVDNSPHAFGYQVDNGIPIESWFDDPADNELLHLLDFLRQLQGAEDVRPLVRNHFRTHELIAAAL